MVVEDLPGCYLPGGDGIHFSDLDQVLKKYWTHMVMQNVGPPREDIHPETSISSTWLEIFRLHSSTKYKKSSMNL
ncbi:hypothetical protein C0J52_27915 [Blattella germanica]|nr:hypothetical protein C0J52_27915 [Blattella germanica]